LPHTLWESFGWWHCGQLASAGAESFQFARREFLRALDVLLFGTAIYLTPPKR
jgi:hypothetical protein